MHTTGQLFRKLIDGLMDELQARKAMKEGFRLGMTRLKATDNNALKHLSDAEAFIQTILFTQNPTFSSAENAVSEGFRDLKFHRIAMAAGIQASLNAHLNQFDPEMIEKLVDSSNPLTKKSKCWDFYCARFPELKMATIQDFFGEEFADEYENQIRNLTL